MFVLAVFATFLFTGCVSYQNTRSDVARAISQIKPPKYQPGEQAVVAQGWTSGQVDLAGLARILAAGGTTNLVNLTNMVATTNSNASVGVGAVGGVGTINVTNQVLMRSGLEAVIGLQHHQIEALKEVGVAQARGNQTQGTSVGIGALFTPSPYYYGSGPNYGYGGGYWAPVGGHNYGGYSGYGGGDGTPNGYNTIWQTPRGRHHY